MSSLGVESILVFEGPDKQLLGVVDLSQLRDIELFIVGAVSALHIGVVLPPALADAQCLDVEGSEEVLL